MAVTIADSGNSSAVVLAPGESVAICGTLTGTATLTPKLSNDNGATYWPVSSPSDMAATVAFTATFGWVELKAPSKTPPKSAHYLFRLENGSGGSWSVDGVPAT